MTNEKTPWVEKYRPQNTGEVIGQSSAITAILSWVKNFKNEKEKALLLTGPIGSGKTSLAQAVAKELEYELIDTNASDFRKKDQIEEKIGSACRQMSLLGPVGKIILIDEVDGVSGNSDRGGMAALNKIINTTCFPIILTAADKWDRKLSTLRKKCKGVDLRKVDIRLATKKLEEIAEKEGLEVAKEVLAEVARRSEGDLRAAINDLESVSGNKKITMKDLQNVGNRDKIKNIFDTLFAIYKSKDPKVIMDSVWACDKSPEEIMLWLIETIPKEYEKPDEVALAFDAISRADVFTGRISKRGAWTFMSYSAELMALGTALAKEQKYSKFTRYMPPTYLMRMGRTRASRAMRKQVAGKIGEHLHCSQKRAMEQLPYFQMMLKKGAKGPGGLGAEYFGFDEDEMEFLAK
ncbi:MAG: replication factor C large subunit [archaeon]